VLRVDADLALGELHWRLPSTRLRRTPPRPRAACDGLAPCRSPRGRSGRDTGEFAATSGGCARPPRADFPIVS